MFTRRCCADLVGIESQVRRRWEARDDGQRVNFGAGTQRRADALGRVQLVDQRAGCSHRPRARAFP
jgi:hypothetical protein